MSLKQLLMPIVKAFETPLQVRIVRDAEKAFSLPQSGFPASVNLPKKHGYKMPERVIEIFLAKLTYASGLRVLDVGHANAMECHLTMLTSLQKPLDITGIDIAPPIDSVRPFYPKSVQQDISATTFEDGTFDLIWCISALEHFGMDNSGYTGDFTIDKQLDVRALKEMHRILKPGGRILVTVPYGKWEDHGWLRNYDADHWQALLGSVRPVSKIEEIYFKYSPDSGWQQSSPAALASTGYYDHRNSGAGGLAAVIVTKK